MTAARLRHLLVIGASCLMLVIATNRGQLSLIADSLMLCSNDGDWRSAVNIRQRMKSLGCTVSVHVYNALIAALERANQWDQVIFLTPVLLRFIHPTPSAGF